MHQEKYISKKAAAMWNCPIRISAAAGKPTRDISVSYTHLEDAARSEDCSDGADDACIVLFKQRTDDRRENNFSEIDDRHVEGHI